MIYEYLYVSQVSGLVFWVSSLVFWVSSLVLDHSLVTLTESAAYAQKLSGAVRSGSGPGSPGHYQDCQKPYSQDLFGNR